MRVEVRLALLFVLCLAFSTFADSPRKIETDAFAGVIYQASNIYIAGQPLNPKALKQMQDRGVVTVVNLRTPEEMKSQGPMAAEKEIVDALGMNYVYLPSGGADYPYSPDTVKRFAKAVSESSGSVLLHCASGRRASHLWAAYLASEKGVPLEEAIRMAKQVNFGSQPFEAFLGGCRREAVEGGRSPRIAEYAGSRATHGCL